MFQVVSARGVILDTCETFRDAIASARCEVDGVTCNWVAVTENGECVKVVEYLVTNTYAGAVLRNP